MPIVLSQASGATRPLISPANHSRTGNFLEICKYLIWTGNEVHSYLEGEKRSQPICVPYFQCLTPKPISFSRVEQKKSVTEADCDPVPKHSSPSNISWETVKLLCADWHLKSLRTEKLRKEKLRKGKIKKGKVAKRKVPERSSPSNIWETVKLLRSFTTLYSSWEKLCTKRLIKVEKALYSWAKAQCSREASSSIAFAQKPPCPRKMSRVFQM